MYSKSVPRRSKDHPAHAVHMVHMGAGPSSTLDSIAMEACHQHRNDTKKNDGRISSGQACRSKPRASVARVTMA